MDENNRETNTRSEKLCITGMCFLSFIAYGFCCAVVPQTLRDLEQMMSVDTATISIMFSVRSVFYCLGAVFLGWLFNKWNRQLLFALCMLTVAVTFVLVPIFPNYQIFLSLSCANGFAFGGIDTAANVLILEMWGKDNNPFLQALHLSFAVGTVVGPLMCTPFVSPENNSTQLLTIFNESQFENKIVIPYAITGAIALLSAIALFVFELIRPYKTPERSVSRRDQTNEAINSDTEELIPQTPVVPKSYYYTVVALASLVMFMLLCAEPMFFNFLPTFLQKVKVGKIKSMFMSAVFGGSFTLFRFLSIFIALRVKSSVMLYMFFLLSLISGAVMLIFGSNSVLVLWITCATSGAGFASLYPSLFSFVEERIDVTNIIGGIFMFAGSTATTITPLIIGHLIENKPLVFLDFNIICVIAMIVLFVGLHCTDIWKANYRTNE